MRQPALAFAIVAAAHALSACQRSPRREPAHPELAFARPAGDLPRPAPLADSHRPAAKAPEPPPVAPPPAPGPPRARSPQRRVRTVDLINPFADDRDLLRPGATLTHHDPTALDNPFGNPPPAARPKPQHHLRTPAPPARDLVHPDDLRNPFAAH